MALLHVREAPWSIPISDPTRQACRPRDIIRFNSSLSSNKTEMSDTVELADPTEDNVCKYECKKIEFHTNIRRTPINSAAIEAYFAGAGVTMSAEYANYPISLHQKNPK